MDTRTKTPVRKKSATSDDLKISLEIAVLRSVIIQEHFNAIEWKTRIFYKKSFYNNIGH